MTGLSSMTCVLVLGLQLTGALAQFRGQWGYPGYGGGGYFQRPRAQRFASYGGYSGVRGREFNVPLSNDKTRENWPENSLSGRTSPFKYQQQPTRVTTARPTATTTTRTTTTITTTTTTTRAPTTRKVKEFIPVLKTSTERITQEMDPYLSIDINRFPVIAAVPGSGNPETTDLSRAALSSGISVTESQALNSVSSRRIPSGFSPVPAVPGSAPASSASLVSTPAPVIAREEPKVAPTKFISARLEKEVIEERQPVAEERAPIIDASRTQRKQFKRCHGKCVQKFCLPIDSLTVYDTCSAKCKGICSQ